MHQFGHAFLRQLCSGCCQHWPSLSSFSSTWRSDGAHTLLHSSPLHYSKTSTGYPLNGEYISNWPPWRIRHCTLASHLTCPNCYNIMNPHGLCDLSLLLNSLFHDTTLNLACVHFESQHQKICNLLPASIRNSPSIPAFRRHLKHIIFSQPMLTPNDHPLPTRPDSL